MPDPASGPGEVRVRIITSGINSSDWKRRQGLTRPIAFPRAIPHQDGAGIIDHIGPGVLLRLASAHGSGSTNPRTVSPTALVGRRQRGLRDSHWAVHHARPPHRAWPRGRRV